VCIVLVLNDVNYRTKWVVYDSCLPGEPLDQKVKCVVDIDFPKKISSTLLQGLSTFNLKIVPNFLLIEKVDYYKKSLNVPYGYKCFD
jgi:hypothetical protein